MENSVWHLDLYNFGWLFGVNIPRDFYLPSNVLVHSTSPSPAVWGLWEQLPWLWKPALWQTHSLYPTQTQRKWPIWHNRRIHNVRARWRAWRIYSITTARAGAGLTTARRAVIGARGKSHASCPRGLLRCVASRVVWGLDTEATPTAFWCLAVANMLVPNQIMCLFDRQRSVEIQRNQHYTKSGVQCIPTMRLWVVVSNDRVC